MDKIASYHCEGIKFPEVVSVQPVISLESVQEKKILIVNSKIGEDEILNILNQLKVSDHSPLVILLGKEISSETIRNFYNAGGFRFVDEDDQRELVRSIQSAERYKKLELENEILLAKLTEANKLLEERNQRLDEFTAMLAHDIRGPLGGVIMKLEYLYDKFADSTEEPFKKLMSRSIGASHRLTQVIQAMYEYAKLGREAVKKEEIVLSDLIQGVIEDLEFDCRDEIKWSIEQLPRVYCSKAVMFRVFQNLFSNSVKHSDKEHQVISVRRGRDIETPLGRFVEILVSDNGPGISSEQQSSMFKFFSRGVTEKEGLGLGLLLVKRGLELHYGDVKVQSQEGSGTTFVLTLPIEPIYENIDS